VCYHQRKYPNKHTYVYSSLRGTITPTPRYACLQAAQARPSRRTGGAAHAVCWASALANHAVASGGQMGSSLLENQSASRSDQGRNASMVHRAPHFNASKGMLLGARATVRGSM
jgi:hypothetical protein